MSPGRLLLFQAPRLEHPPSKAVGDPVRRFASPSVRADRRSLRAHRLRSSVRPPLQATGRVEIFSPALYEPFSGYACAPMQLSRASFHRASDKTSAALLP